MLCALFYALVYNSVQMCEPFWDQNQHFFGKISLSGFFMRAFCDSSDSSDRSDISDSCDSSDKKNCDKTQKLKLWQKSKTQIVTKLNNSNCDKNHKLNLWR